MGEGHTVDLVHALNFKQELPPANAIVVEFIEIGCSG